MIIWFVLSWIVAGFKGKKKPVATDAKPWERARRRQASGRHRRLSQPGQGVAV